MTRNDETPAGLAAVPTARAVASPASTLTGPQRALLFLVSLDEAVATRVIAHLDDAELRALRTCSMTMTEASPRAISAVHHEFLERLKVGVPASLKGSTAYLRRLTGNALGEGRATEVWTEAPAAARPNDLARLEAPVLAALLVHEQPQTVAVVLSQLPPARAAALVAELPAASRGEVLARLARVESVPEAVLRDIEQSFAAHVEELSGAERVQVSGKKVAADIVKRLPRELTDTVIASMRDADPDVAGAVERALFTFEDLLRIDARGMQQLLKEVPTDQLVLALKTASDELKEKIFGNLSSRAADLMNEELEMLGPVRVADVEGAQQAVVDAALELERDGRLQIARDGGGDYV